MNSGRFVRSRCIHTLAAIAFISMAGCIIQVPPGDQPQQSADVPKPPAPPAPDQPYVDPALQQLVSPIALYPDPILADVLPASTYPDQVQQAAQFVQADPSAPDDQIAGQNWDPSVQALAHYPAVLQYMAANADWTASLGSAFVNQQPQVMAAIQDLRAQAQAVGNLQTNQDVEVVDDGGFIYIRPAVDGVIVVPYYDPALVYQQNDQIDYRYRYRDGAWLDHGFDWQHHDVYTGDWHNGWTGGPGNWHRNTNWTPPPQHWAHDDQRFGPVRQVAPAHYTQPHGVQGHDFHPAPARPVNPAYHGPDHVQTPAVHDDRPRNEPQPAENAAQHHDDHPQNTPRPQENPPPPHVNAPPPPSAPHNNAPPPAAPPPEQHARPMPPTKEAPPKGKAPPPAAKGDEGNDKK